LHIESNTTAKIKTMLLKQMMRIMKIGNTVITLAVPLIHSDLDSLLFSLFLSVKIGTGLCMITLGPKVSDVCLSSS
jgi:hypothetical protein